MIPLDQIRSSSKSQVKWVNVVGFIDPVVTVVRVCIYPVVGVVVKVLVVWVVVSHTKVAGVLGKITQA